MIKDCILTAKNVSKTFAVREPTGKKAKLKAVENVNLNVFFGETLSIVGESGCGKSTLGRVLLGLYQPDKGGEILFLGKNIFTLEKSARQNLTRQMQLIFQDPSSCLNPRRNVLQILQEPFIIHNEKDNLDNKISELMEQVGLPKHFLLRYPHEMSGGQKQRISIARALALKPKVIICDEPVSALDVSIQAQIINLLKDAQRDFGLTYVFISHDLSVVHHISDRIAVMYLGKMVELANRDALYTNTLHPYTKALISSIPETDSLDKRQRIILSGDVPSPANPPTGCRFHTRCPEVMGICRTKEPHLRENKKDHLVACHLYNNK